MILPYHNKSYSNYKLTDAWEMLIKLEAHELLQAIAEMSEIIHLGARDPLFVYKDEDHMKHLYSASDNLKTHLAALDLKYGVQKVNTIRYVLSQYILNKFSLDFTAKQIKHDFIDLMEYVCLELKSRLFYHITPAEAELYVEGLHVFDSEVLDKFHDAQFDLDQAIKCKAFDRHTASVYHLMRAMEHALHVISKDIGVHLNKNWNWATIIQKLDKKVKPMPKGDNKDYWSTIIVQLGRLKDCCRNKTMHVAAEYSKEGADNVYLAVKALLTSLTEKTS